MVGGMSDQNPPPHTSENTAPEITTRTRIGIGIGIGGLYTLIFLVIVPWAQNLLNTPESIVILLSYSTPLVLILIFVSGMVTQAKAHQRQQDP